MLADIETIDAQALISEDNVDHLHSESRKRNLPHQVWSEDGNDLLVA